MLKLIVLCGIVALALSGSMPSEEEMDKWMEAQMAEEDKMDKPATQRRCPTPVPGLDRMKRGVDLVSLSVKPFDFTLDDGYKRPVVELTCAGNNKWRNPYNNVQYDLPDQIAGITAQPGEVLDHSTSVMKAMDEVRSEYSKETELGLDFGHYVGFSDSLSFKHIHNELQNSSKYIQGVASHVSAFRVDFNPPFALNLTSMVNQFINQWLPPTYEANPEAYNYFIRYFGTHYWEEAKFGGMLKLHMETSKSLYSVMTEASIKQESEISFMSFLSFIGATSTTVREVNSRFKESTRETRRFYGGQGNMLDRSFYGRWKQTIPGNPWLFSGKILPLSVFIPDVAKRNAMDKAVQVYNDVAVLGELERTVLWFVNEVNGVQTTGNWATCRSLPATRCSMKGVSGGNCGCLVTGCEWANFHTPKKQLLVRQAQPLLSSVRTQQAAGGRNHAMVLQLTRQVRILIRNMATESPSRTVQAVRNIGQQCYRRCRSWRRCRCCQQSEVWASTKAPAPFFSRSG